MAVLWLWLALRFRPEAFPAVQEAQDTAAAIIGSMARGLKRMSAPKAPSPGHWNWCTSCRCGRRTQHATPARTRLVKAADAAEQPGHHSCAQTGWPCVCRAREPADAAPELAGRPFLCPPCRAKRREVMRTGYAPLVTNADDVAQQYLRRWAERRRAGDAVNRLSDYAELASAAAAP